MRLALFSDIHGNSVALEAVLADIDQQGGVDGYWVLGDLVALGPDPAGVLTRLARLPNLKCTRGNTDRYTTNGDRPPPTLAEAQANPELLPVLVEVAGSFAWTQGAINAAGWYEWLIQLPVEQRLALPDGTRMLGVHASPGRDGGCGLHREFSDKEIRSLIKDSAADLIFCGHTHVPMDRTVSGVRIINLGSVSNPLAPDLRAGYTILKADSHGIQIEHHRVAYDYQAVITDLQRRHHPGAAFIIRHMRGEMTPLLHDLEFPAY